MATLKSLLIVMSPSTTTGIWTTPAVVKDVLAVMVRVGDVASVSLVTVIPVGAVT